MKAAERIDVTVHPTEWLRMNLERVALLEHQLGSIRTKGSGASKVFDAILGLLLNSKQAFEAYNTDTERKDFGMSRNNHEHGDADENVDESCEIRKSGLNSENIERGKNILPKRASVDGDKRNSGDKSAKCETNNSAEDVPRLGEESDAEIATDEEFLNLLDIFEARLKNCLKEHIKLRATGKTSVSTQHKEREDVLKRMYELTLRASVTRKTEEMSSVGQCEQILETIVALERLQNKTDSNS